MTILTCSSSLTLSIGATAVLEIAAATPPAKKSLAKEIVASAMAIILKLGLFQYTICLLNVLAEAGGRAESDGDAAEDTVRQLSRFLAIFAPESLGSQ